MSRETQSTPRERAAPPPFHLVRAGVSAVERVSPSFARITFAGPGLADFGTPGATFDQRIKLVFPPDTGVLPELSGAGHDWYRAWLEVPEAERGSMRTYSIRELRAAGGRTEVIVDFVLHLEPGLTGPASRWADRAAVGDELILIGPRRGRSDGGGVEWDPGSADEVLLAGDETAAPAIARILEDAAETLRGAAYIEVPEAADRLPISAPAGVAVHWLVRGAAPHGSALIPAISAALGASTGDGEAEPTASAAAVSDAADPAQLLWETPQYSGSGEEIAAASAPHAGGYFWIAGESGVVTTLRRHLVKTLGIDRSRVAFMGYWRRGVAMRG
ncbi:siderophore-interacting protein [Leucobacter allii]|uniref:siderophore-interacting protein n=1 Tax=Leucobacter allii TaxID=2932247 RepID=UPI001FD14660|nr:siderophore-interacting protein [Leucobacter allii]UOR00955.1 siderophore-interacting protein [Leucobacter allii]